MAYPDLPTLGEGIYGRLAPGTSLSHKPRVNKAEFGGGYTQRSGDGLNADPRQVVAKFVNMEEDVATMLDQFLIGRKGYLPFYVQIPGYSNKILFTCESWDRSYSEVFQDTITATFVECFDP